MKSAMRLKNLPLEKKQTIYRRTFVVESRFKSYCKRYNIPLGSKDTNVQIIDKLVENVVGSKLKFDALLNTDLKR